jgi:D-tagatose-1,6-bisphosphate aldolase subunit GatZ/KbaZ
LIEATCNQVNQEGGYTGMTPARFRSFVESIAGNAGLPLEGLILGGDHLGPNPWKNLPAQDAMTRAEAMVDAYTRAGFSKLHLDTSMACADDPRPVPPEDIVAERAARLAAVAEAAARDCGLPKPVYVIGTEVPIPGGALETLHAVEVTRPEAVVATVELHRRAFERFGISEAFSRCIAVVVQPGVEFGTDNVLLYDAPLAAPLSAARALIPGFVFEAHSTDYQPQSALAMLVRDGFAILKVGPGLTFAMREALYGLDAIAAELRLFSVGEGLKATMEKEMLTEWAYWEPYYTGTPEALHVQRHFSYSDRIRYYWPRPNAQAAVERLLGVFDGQKIPATLISQYLGGIYAAATSRRENPTARWLLLEAIQRVLREYHDAGKQAVA